MRAQKYKYSFFRLISTLTPPIISLFQLLWPTSWQSMQFYTTGRITPNYIWWDKFMCMLIFKHIAQRKNTHSDVEMYIYFTYLVEEIIEQLTQGHRIRRCYNSSFASICSVWWASPTCCRPSSCCAWGSRGSWLLWWMTCGWTHCCACSKPPTSLPRWTPSKRSAPTRQNDFFWVFFNQILISSHSVFLRWQS